MIAVGPNLLVWIPLTQVGDPLAHGQKGFVDCVSAHRVVGLSLSSEAQGEDEEVTDLVVLARERTEGSGLAVFLTELGPSAEDGVPGSSVLACSGLGGERERSAEISCEAVSGGKWSSRQGLACG